MRVLHVLKVIIIIISKLWEKLPLNGRKEEVVHLSFQTGVSDCQSLKCPSFRIYSLPLYLVKRWFTFVGWFFFGELFLVIIIIFKKNSKLWLHLQIIYVLHCIFNPLYPITTSFLCLLPSHLKCFCSSVASESIKLCERSLTLIDESVKCWGYPKLFCQ